MLDLILCFLKGYAICAACAACGGLIAGSVTWLVLEYIDYRQFPRARALPPDETTWRRLGP